MKRASAGGKAKRNSLTTQREVQRQADDDGGATGRDADVPEVFYSPLRILIRTYPRPRCSPEYGEAAQQQLPDGVAAEVRAATAISRARQGGVAHA